MLVHHIGYLVRDIQLTIKEFEMIGFNLVKAAYHDEIRQIEVAFVEKDGYYIELIQPTDKKSPIYNLRDKYKLGPYHICYAVPNLADAINYLCNNCGYIVITGKEAAPAININSKVAFLMNKDLGMVELLQVEGDNCGR